MQASPVSPGAAGGPLLAAANKGHALSDSLTATASKATRLQPLLIPGAAAGGDSSSTQQLQGSCWTSGLHCSISSSRAGSVQSVNTTVALERQESAAARAAAARPAGAGAGDAFVSPMSISRALATGRIPSQQQQPQATTSNASETALMHQAVNHNGQREYQQHQQLQRLLEQAKVMQLQQLLLGYELQHRHASALLQQTIGPPQHQQHQRQQQQQHQQQGTQQQYVRSCHSTQQPPQHSQAGRSSQQPPRRPALPVMPQPQHRQLLQLHQMQMQQQQQLYSAPLPSRPWGWWRQPGGGSILRGLDAVRPPLLQLHTALGGSADSSMALLQALGHQVVTPAQQQQQRGVSGAELAECWQRLAAAEAARQQASPPHRLQQQQLLQLQGPCPASAAASAAASTAADPGVLQAEGAVCQEAAAAAVAAGKPPKRPWQPRMAPDDANWDEAAFTDIQASCQQLGAPPAKWPRSLPEHSTATFAQLMLLHGAGWPNHLMWEQWKLAHPEGSMAMFVHMKAGVALSHGMPGRELINKYKLKVSVDAGWGDISLVEAQLHGMKEILRRCPNVTHIGLASGHDVPVQLIQPGLLLPGVSLFGLYQFGATEMVTLKDAVVDELVENSSLTKAEAHAWGDALTFHHQWMVLSREHAAALLQHQREIMVIGRLLHKACCSVRAGMAPDEFIVITALRQRGYVRSMQRVEVKPNMRYPPGCMLNSYPTFVVFPAEASPHPVLWTHPDKKVRCQVEKKGTSEQRETLLSLNDCLDLAVDRCAIYFRKVEIRQTREEEMVMLLSSLEAMWEGRRKGSSTAVVRNSSASTGSKRRAKRKASNSTCVTPQTSQDADVSPACSAAAMVQDAPTSSMLGFKKPRGPAEVVG